MDAGNARVVLGELSTLGDEGLALRVTFCWEFRSFFSASDVFSFAFIRSLNSAISRFADSSSRYIFLLAARISASCLCVSLAAVL